MVCEVHLYLHYLCPTKRCSTLKYTLHLLNKWHLSKPCMKQRRPSPTQTLYWFCQKPMAEWIQPFKEINIDSHYMIVYCCEMYICTVNIFNNQHGSGLRTPKFLTLNGLSNVALAWYSSSLNYSTSIISFCYCDFILKFSPQHLHSTGDFKWHLRRPDTMLFWENLSQIWLGGWLNPKPGQNHLTFDHIFMGSGLSSVL